MDCVEDKDEDGDDSDGSNNLLPVKTNLHVGPLRKKTDSPKNQSVPSLIDASDNAPKLSSASSLPMCPVHGTFRQVIVPVEKQAESRIPIPPRSEFIQEYQVSILSNTLILLNDLNVRRKLSEREIIINYSNQLEFQ